MMRDDLVCKENPMGWTKHEREELRNRGKTRFPLFPNGYALQVTIRVANPSRPDEDISHRVFELPVIRANATERDRDFYKDYFEAQLEMLAAHIRERLSRMPQDERSPGS